MQNHSKISTITITVKRLRKLINPTTSLYLIDFLDFELVSTVKPVYCRKIYLILDSKQCSRNWPMTIFH